MCLCDERTSDLFLSAQVLMILSLGGIGIERVGLGCGHVLKGGNGQSVLGEWMWSREKESRLFMQNLRLDAMK